MLMPYQVKIIFLPEPLLPCALHLPLELDDILAQYEPRFKEAHQDPRRNRNEMLVPPGIAHENSAVLTRLEDAEALDRYFPHFFGELGDVVHV